MAITDILRIIVPVSFRESGTENDLIIFDATPNENHTRRATPTRNPVEQGADLTDHVRLQPKSYSAEVWISDSPISFLSIATTGISSITDFTDRASRSQAAFQTLEKLWSDRIPFDIVTRTYFYQNMIITSLTVPRNAQFGNVMRAQIVLEQIEIVTLEDSPPPTADEIPSPTANLGLTSVVSAVLIPAAVVVAAGAYSYITR
jgi:hypothetical protein